MHLEERNSGAAIRKAADKIFHFHACENDRGVPGAGQVHWDEVAAALKDVRYDGPVVIESFTSEVKEIARAVCIWREIAPEPGRHRRSRDCVPEVNPGVRPSAQDEVQMAQEKQKQREDKTGRRGTAPGGAEHHQEFPGCGGLE